MVPAPGGKAPGPGPGAAPFEKKGEVSELRQLLRTAAVDRDQQKKREAIKKVIAYMTLGIDVSPLFSEMVMASATNDLVQKKMVYLYLVNYAESNSELAILAVNTLQKDCRDDDPMIRGLALRSLCSLNLQNMVEYLEPAIKQALSDVNGYVRKTAVIGCVKLYSISPGTVVEGEMLKNLHKLMQDGDTHVCANAISALNEILDGEGGINPSKEVVTTLLNRISQFSEWGQCAIITLVSKYRVQDEAEMFDIMNIFEGLLKQSSSAVILGVTKVFLDLTANRPDLQQPVIQRFKAPLLTLMATATPELAYTVLAHIQLLAARDTEATIFGAEYKQFFCRFNDPSYIKGQKLEILTAISTQENALLIVSEMSEYVTDVDAEVSRRSIRAIGDIAVRVASASESIVETLIGLLDLDIDYVSTEAVVVMKDLLRKYPQTFMRAAGAVERCMKLVTEPEGRCAMLWILGEYGDSIERAPYLIEPLIDGFTEEGSAAVRLETLTATAKLFFRRAPEMQKMLGRVLHAAINETTHPDVRDRALLYYRLLHHSVDEASRIIDCKQDTVSSFQEEGEREILAQIFEEFNTLSVVYRQPSQKFVPNKGVKYVRERGDVEEDAPQSGGADIPYAHTPAPENVASADMADLLGNDDAGPPPPPPPAPPVSEPTDLLGMGDLLDMGEPGPAVGDFAPPTRVPPFSLEAAAVMDPGRFQAEWARLPVGEQEGRPIRFGTEAQLTTAIVDDLLKRANFKVIASGKMPPPTNALKLYFCGQQGTGPAPKSPGPAWFYLELVMTPGAQAAAILKADNADSASTRACMDLLWNSLEAFF